MAQSNNTLCDKIPPVTLMILSFLILLYSRMIKVPWCPRQACLSSYKIIRETDARAFLFANFEHGSDLQLYFSMISFLLKGAYLEPIYGGKIMAALVLIMSILASTIYVIAGYLIYQFTGNRCFYTACIIGFSTVTFALKVIVACEYIDREGNRRDNDPCCVKIPQKVAIWIELALIHIIVPCTSFLGNISGYVAGAVYCFTPVGDCIDSKLAMMCGKPVDHKPAFLERRKWI